MSAVNSKLWCGASMHSIAWS